MISYYNGNQVESQGFGFLRTDKIIANQKQIEISGLMLKRNRRFAYYLLTAIALILSVLIAAVIPLLIFGLILKIADIAYESYGYTGIVGVIFWLLLGCVIFNYVFFGISDFIKKLFGYKQVISIKYSEITNMSKNITNDYILTKIEADSSKFGIGHFTIKFIDGQGQDIEELINNRQKQFTS